MAGIMENTAPRLYAIGDRDSFETDEQWLAALERVANALIPHKHTALQIRCKKGDVSRRRALITRARLRLSGAVAAGLPLLLNGPHHLALELGFSGVHLPEANIPNTPMARDELSYIGASIHNKKALHRAAQAGAHFVILGPVFPPLSKIARPIGLEKLSQTIKRSTIPILALGGITVSRVESCMLHGCHGVATNTTIMTSPNPIAVTTQFMSAINSKRSY